jgi:hypothetical protein
MTIAISVRVGEGLVYAADSTSSLFETINDVSVLSQSFHHAKKLVQVRDFPIGVLTYGLGLIGSRNVESLVAEYESEILPKDADSNVKAVAEGLRDFLASKYDESLPPPAASLPELDVEDSRPRLGVVVGGYTAHHFTPEEYVLELPSRNLAERDQNVHGVNWWGQTEALQRLLLGYDARLWGWMAEKGVSEENLPGIFDELRGKLQWKIAFDGMPLQDAIDFATFLTNLAIGQSRFVVGPPVCGGHVDVATISHRGFAWIRRKAYGVKSDSAFF